MDWSEVPEPASDASEEEIRRHTAIHAAGPSIAYAREAMNQGKVCIRSGAWPSTIYPWCMWGIVTKASGLSWEI